jgi:cobalt-zinc-cadmium resistance protein CzcA
MVEYINQLRARGQNLHDAALHGSARRLRPVMMTILVATLGLLPAAMSHGIGSDSQRPFAIVIVGSLLTGLALSLILLPTLDTWVAAPGDVLSEDGEENIEE